VSAAPDRTGLRAELRARRRAIGAAARLAAAEALAERLLQLPFAPRSGYVAGYWAMDGEIALHVWQLRLPAACVYCLPVLHADGRLRFAPWRTGDPLARNRHGIPEPEVAVTSLLEPADMALVVTPLVGFDMQGHRLGMGGGWYDRSFAFRHGRSVQSRPAPPWLVGAAFAVQQADAFTREDWDVTLDAVCSERDTFLFTPSA
jgi:5-formyltetrahydrofolate cyclo-ligase